MDKINEYGIAPKYEVGDKVKVWAIFKNPIGTIESVKNLECFPITYVVRYTYEDTGIEYTEEFEDSDLSLHEKKFSIYGGSKCECGANNVGSLRHSVWCKNYSQNNQ